MKKKKKKKDLKWYETRESNGVLLSGVAQIVLKKGDSKIQG
jgi:hypothetical protein